MNDKQTVFIGHDLESVQQMIDIQKQPGNWDSNPYMMGLYNGLELALAALEGRNPELKSDPDEGFRHCFHTCKDTCDIVFEERMRLLGDDGNPKEAKETKETDRD